jgi:hypothetical protein
LLQRFAEVLALYSSFHSLLLRGGSLKSFGLFFMTKWTIFLHLAVEQGFSHATGDSASSKVGFGAFDFCTSLCGEMLHRKPAI